MQTLSTYSSIGWDIDANLGSTGTIWVLNSSFGSLSYLYPQIRENEVVYTKLCLLKKKNKKRQSQNVE